MEILQIDENMRCADIDAENTLWHDPQRQPFHILGFPFWERGGVFRRLPLCSQGLVEQVNPELNLLARHTAGGQIAFCTDSPFLCVRVWLDGPAALAHMAATGECGFDCYIKENGAWLFMGSAKYDIRQTHYEALLCDGLSARPREMRLNFPLYMGVKKVLVGIAKGSALSAPPPPRRTGRVVVYGTSITQGGCASRPGMSYTNLLSRKLDVEFVNLGFSGNGFGEPQIAALMAEIRDVKLFLLDYETNAARKGTFESSLPIFVDTLRRSYPTAPILLLSLFRLPAWMDPETRAAADARRAFQENFVKERRAHGDLGLYFLNGENLMGENWHECTVDGIHPTDLGFSRMATALEEPIRRLLDA